MLGIVVELLLSYLLLKYIAGRDLSALGLRPTKARVSHFLFGLFVPIVFLCLYKFAVACLVANPYKVNQAYSLTDFFITLAYVLRSVAYEELLFRAALLWLLIQRFGENRGIITSAFAFGFYHWFAWNAFGSPVQMAIVLLNTGSMGYLFALAFARTGSMYMGFGLHLGINIVSMVIFSNDSAIGLQLMEKTFRKDPVVPGAFISIIVILLHYVGPQLVVLWVVRQYKKTSSLYGSCC